MRRTAGADLDTRVGGCTFGIQSSGGGLAMLSKLRPRSVYDVMAALSLFFVVAGGSAYATHELILSSDIVDGEVKTPDIANAAVVTDKLAQGAVTSGKVKDDDLTGGDVAVGSIMGIDVADDSLKGADVDESTLGRVPVAVLGGYGRSVETQRGCDPDEPNQFVDCGFVRLDVPAENRTGATRVLMIGGVRGVTEDPFPWGEGTCRLLWSLPNAPGTPLPDSVTFFDTEDDRGDSENAPLMGVTRPVGPGTLDFGMECREDAGGISFQRASVAAVAISPR
jgi:hypothetical protein